MSALIVVFMALWSAVGGQIDIHPSAEPVRFVDLYGQEREEPAALACAPGLPPQLWIGRGLTLDIFVHELAHAYDCLDDGLLNGSPMPRPEQRPDWVSDYCWDSSAEWYACWVTYTGSTSFPVVAPPDEETSTTKDGSTVDGAGGGGAAVAGG